MYAIIYYMFYEVAVEGRIDEALTYESEVELCVGQIVMVPVMRKSVAGVVVKKVARPEFACKKITKILYSTPLPRHLVAAMKFIRDYYVAPMGSVASMVLPNGVEKKRRRAGGAIPSAACPSGTLRAALAKSSCPAGHAALGMAPPGCSTAETEQGPSPARNIDIPLNRAQKNALKSLQEAPGATKLLFGVTGSGKTNIYLRMAADALLAQKSVVLLVPEIALTGQLVRVFQEVFHEKVVMIHSKQTEAERHLIFNDLLESQEAKVVVGPRSALFAPLNNLGLIIIDEEHESTYYQENTPKYSAVRVASFMAKTLDVPCILGSATPNLVDYYIAREQGSLVKLTEKAKQTAKKANISVISLTNRDNFSKNRYFSTPLIGAIKRNLEQGQQTLLFHNRRGSSPLTICEKCGEELLCPNCFLPLTLHADAYELRCHTCDFKAKVPPSCPKCGHPDLIHKGFGTKLLENELKRLFPKARVMRFDADSKKDEALEAVYDAVKSGEVDILVGTQTLAKGLDLPRLATVGVVAADAGLSLPDFAAEERVFQLLTQVIGRVGRGHMETAEVFIQTFQPDNPVIRYAVEEDYLGFSEYLLKRRQIGGFPPYKYVLKLTLTAKTEVTAVKKVREVVANLAKNPRFEVSPPKPAFHERTQRGYTWEVIVRATSRKALVEACQKLDKNCYVSLDPPSIL